MAINDPWGDYWRGGALTTFGDKPTYQGELRDYWLHFLSYLDANAVLLDLGAGNGALEEIVQEFCESRNVPMTVHAVDAAAVSPQVKPVETSPCRIVWHARTRNEKTGLPEASVDAVIGNYALEYGDDALTIAEIGRVLKPGGNGRFLMHHVESVLIIDSAGELDVLDAALETGGLFDQAKAFLQEFGDVTDSDVLDRVQRAGKLQEPVARIDEARNRTSRLAITPNAKALLRTLASGISSLISPPRLYEPRHVLLQYLATAQQAYEINRLRLRDMKNASVDEVRLHRMIESFKIHEIEAHAQPFFVAGFETPVGWSMDLSKT